MSDWHHLVIDDPQGIADLIRATRRIAVLGIKTEDDAAQPAYYVPAYMARAGFAIVPVPIYYPDATSILGQPIYRKLAAVPGPIDMVDVFRRSEVLFDHLDDVLAAKPAAVWLQQDIRDDAFAQRLAEAGIKVVRDRCLMVEHRNLAGQGCTT